jgi:phage terminase large subunit
LPQIYIDALDNLTGIRKQKYRYGLWVRAEGVIYKSYDSSRHLKDLYDVNIDKTKRFIVSIDFGYTHPFSASLWYVDGDGRMFQIRQVYHSKRTVAEHAPAIRKMVKGFPVEAWITDHDAEDRATLERELGIVTIPAYKSVKDGIEAVEQRFADDRLFLCRGALVETDLLLEAEKEPLCTIEEIPGYVWSDKKQDTPVKERDHGLDEMRYAVAYIDDIGRQKTSINPKASVSNYLRDGKRQNERPGF